MPIDILTILFKTFYRAFENAQFKTINRLRDTIQLTLKSSPYVIASTLVNMTRVYLRLSV